MAGRAVRAVLEHLEPRQLLAADDPGLVLAATVDTPANLPPVLRISGPTLIPEGAPYTLSLFSSDPDGDAIIGWVIDWGDGTIDTIDGNPSSATHTYADGPNIHPITATATDQHGSYTVRTRLTTGEPLDATFGTNGIATIVRSGTYDHVTGLAVQPDGRIIVVGPFGSPTRSAVIRYNVDGSRDGSFFAPTLLTNTRGDAAVAFLSDGTVAVAASSSFGGIAVVRLDPASGSILTRSEVGTGTLGQIHIHALADGRFYVAGRGNGGFTVARMTATGALDPGFGVRQAALPGSSHRLAGVIVGPDEKVTLAGATLLWSGWGAVLVRYNPDGTPDTTFGGGDGIATPWATMFSLNSVLLMPDGSMLAADASRLALFKAADGSQDMTFGTNGYRAVPGSSGAIVSILREASGGYLLTTEAREVLRLNADFTPDTAFGNGGRASVALSGAHAVTGAAALTPGGDIVIGGAAGAWTNDADLWVARLLTAPPPVTVTDVPPAITLGGDPSVADGATYTLNLAADDPGTDTITGWVIDWDDGSPPQTITGNPSSVTHTFADGPGDYTVSASAIDEHGTHGPGTLDVSVTGELREFEFDSDDVTLSAAVIDENGTVTLSGSFVDARRVHVITVNWGDGSPNTVHSLPRGTYAFSLVHRYQDDPQADPNEQYPIELVIDNGSATRAASSEVKVLNRAPTFSLAHTLTVNEGAPVILDPAAADEGPLDVLTHEWLLTRPDGQTVPLGNAPTGTFTPVDDGVFTVTFTVADGDGAVLTQSITITVLDVPPTLTATSTAPQITEGHAFVLNLAATDPGDDTVSSWTVDWGDGSPVEVLPGDARKVSHVYVDGWNAYDLSVRAADEQGAYLARLVGIATAGRSDRRFSEDGRRTYGVSGWATSAVDVLVQPDGRPVVVGTVGTTFVGVKYGAGGLWRYDLDGSFDSSFSPSPISDREHAFTAAALDGEGRIVVAGEFIDVAPPVRFVARYHPDGPRDLTFGQDGTGIVVQPAPHATFRRLLVLPDGDILIGGETSGPGGADPASLCIVRMNSDGGLRTEFGSGGIAIAKVGSGADQFADLAVGADGTITVVGTGNSPSTGSADWAILRFAPDGSLDPTFSGDGKMLLSWTSGDDSAEEIEILPDGRFLVAGMRSGSQPGALLARFKRDGTIDPAFGEGGSVFTGLRRTRTSPQPLGMVVDGAGRIVLAGTYIDNEAIVRLEPDGTPDPTFGSAPHAMFVGGSIYQEGASSVRLDARGGIWVTGTGVPTASGNSVLFVARVVTGRGVVHNRAPQVTGLADVRIGLGMPFARDGSFTDPGINDTWSATVDYGDGTGIQPLTLNPDKTFALAHTYQKAGRFTVTVGIRDEEGWSLPTFGVEVRNATIRSTPADDHFDVRLSAGGQYVEFFENAPLTGPPTFTVPLALAGTINFVYDFGYGFDRLTIHSGTFNLQAFGVPAYPSLRNVHFALKGSASVTLYGDSDVWILDVLDDATLKVQPGRKTLRVNQLNIGGNGRLDLTDGTLSVDVNGEPFGAARNELVSTLSQWVRSARNGPAGRWTGPGITSSAARANPLTGLATLPALLGQAWVAVKHTWNGEVNFDNRINADDYFRIDSNYLARPASPTYADGDFNYDGTINADDYFLIDSAFLGQGEPLASSTPATSTLATKMMARAVPAEPEQEKTRKRPVRSIFSDQPVSVLGASRRQSVARNGRRGLP